MINNRELSDDLGDSTKRHLLTIDFFLSSYLHKAYPYDKPFSKVMYILNQSFPVSLKLDRPVTPPSKTALQH